ncbi:MAG: tRNA guanosine(34) transglycosylase Tgt [Actinomycetia bacterium]|nr:tRNA guanosine(34) transglycosylase Tgt [Actinomycetes bacterium]
MEFKITASSGQARLGIIGTARGTVNTPAFMPVGTQATVKAMSPEELREIGAEIILSNTYHLFLRPGHETIQRLGGIHKFMNWPGPVLTDSGGFQVFSLGKIRKIIDEGVQFKSIIDGSVHLFTPENVIKMQSRLGSDIAMVLDECIPFNQDYDYTKDAASRTIKWAELSLTERKAGDIRSGMKIFGIIQGGFIKDLRSYCAEAISGMDFDGTAIGGLSVGEERGRTFEMLDHTIQNVDRRKPLYFMGLGDPVGILEAIGSGVDMFDCVMPTRISRNGSAFTPFGRINLKNKKYTGDFEPVDRTCDCYTCTNYSAAYLKHLIKSREIFASMLLTVHNLNFIFKLVDASRDAIIAGKFKQFRKDFLNNYKI